MTPKKIYIEDNSFDDAFDKEYGSTVAWNYTNDSKLREYVSVDALLELAGATGDSLFVDFIASIIDRLGK